MDVYGKNELLRELLNFKDGYYLVNKYFKVLIH